MRQAAAPGKKTIGQQIADHSMEEVPQREPKPVNPQNLFPTGATMLNLCCSGTVRGGYALGGIVTTPGGSSSGKSVLAMTSMAEGIYDPRFDKYKFIRDDAEAADHFNTDYLFGPRFKERVTKPPLGYSNTIEDFKHNVLTVAKKGEPVIYHLDSLDSLSSTAEVEKEMKKAMAAAKSEAAVKAIKGSYGMEKAKIIGEVLRMINQRMEETNSLLLMVQQIRQKIGATQYEFPWVTSGGEAPYFYSHHQVWLTESSKIKNLKIEIGHAVRVMVRKNKLTGKKRGCRFNVFDDYGVDDIGSMVDWLLENEVWSRNGNHVIDAGEVQEGLCGTRPNDLSNKGSLIEVIERDRKVLVPRLRKFVGECWDVIEENIRLKRIPRFGS